MEEEMNGVEYMPEGMEEEDIDNIPSWITFINSKIQQMEQQTSEIVDRLENITQTTSIVKRGLETIQILTEDRQLRNEQQEVENPGASLYTSEDKLTPTAKKLIEEVEGPLNPERFKDFLIEKSFGKPLPSILPIVRAYTQDVSGLCHQLKQFRSVLKKAHTDYMTGHRKDDCNLEKRIDLLAKNIEKELTQEERRGLRQTEMRDYFNAD